ncbi:hypothetical protein ACPA0F_20625 [Solibacillus silvestris]
MKKTLISVLTVISVLVLSACQQSQKVEEDDIKSFIHEFKSITHNVKVGEKDNAIFLEETKDYFNDKWYKSVQTNRQVNSPFNFTQDAQKDVSLNDVKIDSIEENPDGEGYKVKYTLILSIGEENEVVEKPGNMIIIEDKNKKFLITYDKETMITFDKIKFL